MKGANTLSWGRYPRLSQKIYNLNWRTDTLPDTPLSLLPYGNGRSYGDSCQNRNNLLLKTTGLNHLIAFNPQTGLIRGETGITLSELLNFTVPLGWFLPVTPGTQFATLGGCIANDVHGKNHHSAGTFAHHVTAFELLRSDGERLLCTPEQNHEWFHATIGGLGLTGLITWIELQLKPINSAYLDIETIRYHNMDEFRKLTNESRAIYEYTVAWVDCLSKNESLGRGLFIRANHRADKHDFTNKFKQKKLTIPFDFPSGLLNNHTVKLFNYFYYNKQKIQHKKTISHYEPFFYPLDRIYNWNRIYGKQGFFQYQCVVPLRHYTAIEEILKLINKAETGSFLTVLKEFGNMPSRGMLSFPRPGVTFALDFPNTGKRTLNLMNQLDRVVMHANGAVYPAKDARMSIEAFQHYFPHWEKFKSYIDPKFSSSFWRRVTGENS